MRVTRTHAMTKPPDPREQDVKPFEYPDEPTEESIRYSERKMREERIDKGLDPDTGLPLEPVETLPSPSRILAMPIRSSRLPIEDRVSCTDAIDRAVEAYGLPDVLRSLRLVLNANGIDSDGLVTLALDGNELPIGHEHAKDEAAKELAESINELPDSVYRLGPTDAEWAASRMLLRYLVSLKQSQWTAATKAKAIQDRVLGWIHGTEGGSR